MCYFLFFFNHTHTLTCTYTTHTHTPHTTHHTHTHTHTHTHKHTHRSHSPSCGCSLRSAGCGGVPAGQLCQHLGHRPGRLGANPPRSLLWPPAHHQAHGPQKSGAAWVDHQEWVSACVHLCSLLHFSVVSCVWVWKWVGGVVAVIICWLWVSRLRLPLRMPNEGKIMHAHIYIYALGH